MRVNPEVVASDTKYRSLIPALALVFHLAGGSSGPVSEDALRRAIGWHKYLWSHAKRVYACVTDSAGFSAEALASKIQGKKLSDGFSAREVLRHGWSHLTTTADVRNALDWLVDAGWLRTVGKPAIASGGRPTEVFAINQKVLAK